MRKVETRIKVITKGIDILYIPQIKGCNQDRLSWWFYFIPILGQLALGMCIFGFIESFFWADLSTYGKYAIDLDRGSEEYAKHVIDMEYNKSNRTQYKKQVSYIKYP
jgi:hypothetical protein